MPVSQTPYAEATRVVLSRVRINVVGRSIVAVGITPPQVVPVRIRIQRPIGIPANTPTIAKPPSAGPASPAKSITGIAPTTAPASSTPTSAAPAPATPCAAVRELAVPAEPRSEERRVGK